MANFNLNNFKTAVLTQGIAKPNRFEVLITVPTVMQPYVNDARLVSLFCESANLPQLNLGIAPQRIYGPNYQNPLTIEYGGESIPMSFLVDQKLVVKKFFDTWIHKIVDPVSFHVGYRNSPATGYTSKIIIHQLNERDDPVYSVELVDAFPRNIGILDLNMASQNTPHKLNVTFTYRRWKIYNETERALAGSIYLNKKNEDGTFRQIDFQ